MVFRKIKAHNIDYFDVSRSDKTCSYPEITECPCCHFAIEAKDLDAFFTYEEQYQHETYRFYLISFCKHCRQTFMSEFRGAYLDSVNGYYIFSTPEYSLPSTHRNTAFPEEISNLSPNFVETFSQSEVAEANRLSQIYGVGYRKALEFLVKDYLCHKYPEDSDAICKETLATSIRRIEDTRIKTLAERSTWIGNDETHYVRKHENLNVDDMKRFIKALLIYVESELAFEEALGIERK